MSEKNTSRKNPQMESIFVIKTGSTWPSLSARKGDFEHWIMAAMAVSKDRVRVIDVCNGASLPAPSRRDGVVITGSHSMVTERQPWSDRTADWLQTVVEQDVAVLGICYGHQLLAYALGGEVGDNPRGREFGTVDVYLHESAGEDKLFGAFTSPMHLHVSHTQSVLRLPAGAKCLGWSERDPHQAFAMGDRVWGVQFHPEFDAEIAQEYVEHCRKELGEEGQDPDRIIAQIEDSECGRKLLRCFAGIIK